MGISGNTSRDLLARWDADVNALDPDYVVVLIGINDVWRQFDSPARPEASVSPEDYEANLNAICDKTKAKLIFMTPYYLEPNKNDAMRKRTDEYASICKQIAEKRNIPVIDLQAAFEENTRIPLSCVYHMGQGSSRQNRQHENRPCVFEKDRLPAEIRLQGTQVNNFAKNENCSVFVILLQ